MVLNPLYERAVVGRFGQVVKHSPSDIKVGGSTPTTEIFFFPPFFALTVAYTS